MQAPDTYADNAEACYGKAQTLIAEALPVVRDGSKRSMVIVAVPIAMSLVESAIHALLAVASSLSRQR